MYQRIELTEARLAGELVLSDAARGLVVFVNGSGSSRMSPRNQQVARYLGEHGLATLAAIQRPEQVKAIVSRGGRTDLAGSELGKLQAPLLQIVGALDPSTLGLNRKAARALRFEQHLEVVPGATHLFEEPGTLQDVARLAGAWF